MEHHVTKKGNSLFDSDLQVIKYYGDLSPPQVLQGIRGRKK